MVAETHVQVQRGFTAEEVVHLRIVQRLQRLHHGALRALGLKVDENVENGVRKLLDNKLNSNNIIVVG